MNSTTAPHFISEYSTNTKFTPNTHTMCFKEGCDTNVPTGTLLQLPAANSNLRTLWFKYMDRTYNNEKLLVNLCKIHSQEILSITVSKTTPKVYSRNKQINKKPLVNFHKELEQWLTKSCKSKQLGKSILYGIVTTTTIDNLMDDLCRNFMKFKNKPLVINEEYYNQIVQVVFDAFQYLRNSSLSRYFEFYFWDKLESTKELQIDRPLMHYPSLIVPNDVNKVWEDHGFGEPKFKKIYKEMSKNTICPSREELIYNVCDWRDGTCVGEGAFLYFLQRRRRSFGRYQHFILFSEYEKQFMVCEATLWSKECLQIPHRMHRGRNTNIIIPITGTIEPDDGLFESDVTQINVQFEKKSPDYDRIMELMQKTAMYRRAAYLEDDPVLMLQLFKPLNSINFLRFDMALYFRFDVSVIRSKLFCEKHLKFMTHHLITVKQMYTNVLDGHSDNRAILLPFFFKEYPTDWVNVGLEGAKIPSSAGKLCMRRMRSDDGLALEIFHVYMDAAKCYTTNSFLDALEIIICLYALFNFTLSPVLHRTYAFILDFVGLKPSTNLDVLSVKELFFNCYFET